MATAPALERLYALRQLHDAGYGDRVTLTKRIREGVLPAVKVGNAFKIRERDLHLIGASINMPEDDSRVAPTDELGDLVKNVVDAFPQLSADQKCQLGRLLTSAAA
ncbi:hypothetical protein [Spelaeicoccus albus]|uniref:Uncharacterized protein n=1 Tax=Spelaeicoccus albus TaxID=1280376 RepID=A0A7Z0AAG6_9MICO|nr:hypothetical protein [Spelaeicoccus albus]NYI66073.1 hypothetical protein [Spelaeicoccus albus]